MDQVRYELAALEDKPTNERLQRVKSIVSTVLLLVVSGGVSSTLGYFFYHLDTPGGAIILINLRLRFLPSRHIEWRDVEGNALLEGNLGTNFARQVNHDVSRTNASFMRVRWTNQAVLETVWWKSHEGVQCYQFRWRAPTCIHNTLQDCYSLEGARWYGGGVYWNQRWNVEELDAQMAPFLTGNASGPGQPYGKILNRYWLSSKGVAIFVEPNSPLWVSINTSGDGRLCLKASYEDGPYWQPNDHTPVRLNYTMCAGANMRAVHWYMTHNLFNFPLIPPTEESLALVSNPTWFLTPPLPSPSSSSSSSFPSSSSVGVPTSTVLRTVLEIQSRQENFTKSKLVLNLQALRVKDEPQSVPFNQSKSYRNTAIRELIDQLHSIGFGTVTLEVSPTDFLHTNLRRDYVRQVVFRGSEKYSIPPRIRWETTERQLSRTTSHWFRKVVCQRRRDLNISSFVFRGGHALSLPFHDVLIKGLRSPDAFTSIYQTLAIRYDPEAVFDAASEGQQNLSAFLMMRDRLWAWDGEAGLNTIIPEALTLSLAGYPYLIAPTLAWTPLIDGSLSSASSATAQTSRAELREIFLRWLQVIAFFPSISFSASPTMFDDNNATQVFQEILSLRASQIYRLLNLTRTAHSKRAPILRPLWWVAPGDVHAQTVDDQFLVGNYLLVAPILSRWTWARSIYLPRGEWMDILRNVTYVGPLWLHEYAVTPSQVPHFILQDT